MRSVHLILTVILLAGCGSREAGNEPDPGPAEANLAQAADPEPVAEETNAGGAAVSGSVSPCLTQGTERLAIQPLRAVGTEPFWSARVEGRCVTYSTPEDQQGVRVWARYSPEAAGGGSWVGQLGGKPFELRTRAEPGCSDGMSDKSYPMAAELSVNGEQRRGCAEPLQDQAGTP